MAQLPPEQPGHHIEPDTPANSAARRRLARYGVPIGIAGVAAATIGLVPALAQSDGSPDLKKTTAQDLVAKMLASKQEQVSGTVKVSTDLGLPGIGSLGSGGGGGAGFGGHGGSDSSSSPRDDGSDMRSKPMELLSGSHTLRVAADGPDRQKVSLVGEKGDYSFIHNGSDVWAYDSTTNRVEHSTVPDEALDAKKDRHFRLPKDMRDLTPGELAGKVLDAAGRDTAVSVAGTAKVAGQDAYQLRIAPKQSGTTVKDVRIAVDADNGVPLKVTLTTDQGKKAVDVGFTKVDFGKPDAAQFAFKAPEGAEVTEAKPHAGKHERPGPALGANDAKVIGKGWTSVVRLDLPAGAAELNSGRAKGLLDSFTDKADGGRVFSTHLINVLLTDDGKVYAGAVTKDRLVEAAAQDR